jgi:hypothetical protein
MIYTLPVMCAFPCSSTGMNAHALAEALAPQMLWLQSSITDDQESSAARVGEAMGSAKAAASAGASAVASSFQVRLPDSVSSLTFRGYIAQAIHN